MFTGHMKFQVLQLLDSIMSNTDCHGAWKANDDFNARAQKVVMLGVLLFAKHALVDYISEELQQPRVVEWNTWWTGPCRW